MTLDGYEAMQASALAASVGWCGHQSPAAAGERSFVCTRPAGHRGYCRAGRSDGSYITEWLASGGAA